MLYKIAFFLRVFRISPAIAFRKVYDIIISALKKNRKRLDDIEQTTFFFSDISQEIKNKNRFSKLKANAPIIKNSNSDKLKIIREDCTIEYGYFNLPNTYVIESKKDIIYSVTENTLNHIFNMLGSGFVNVCHGCEVKGLEGLKYLSERKFRSWDYWLKRNTSPRNIDKCLEISSLISPDYIPIDWQLDFKSGFRWNETEWSHDSKYGDVKGADIKVPWELGRMQHLVNLAYSYKLGIGNEEFGNTENKDDNGERTTDNENHILNKAGNKKFLEEFRNEILDFIASNPPRFGVQWMCSMDVGIRAVNWLVAYDLFKSAGAEFDSEFEKIFAESIFEHALHISQNLEWSSGLRGNHYFTNIVSLLFISAYLNTNEITNTWLAFSLQEIINETDEQFLSDGGNFEASLPYHFFVLDMLLYSIFVILSLNKDKTEKLKNLKYRDDVIAKKIFSYENQKFKINADGKIILPEVFWNKLETIINFSLSVLDSSGNTFQIGDNDSGKFIKLSPDLIGSSYSHISSLSLITGLFDYENLQNWIEKHSCFEYFLLKSVERNLIPEIQKMSIHGLLNDFISNIDDTGISSDSFNSFGIYLNKSKKYFSMIRCGEIGQRGKGGHSHNDNLSICLMVEENLIFVDPGTYIYTPLPEIRNLYRSTGMHNTLELVGSEQNEWQSKSKDDLFWFKKDKAKARILDYSNKIFVGEHNGFGKPHKRIITFNNNYIDGVDLCDAWGTKRVNFHLNPDVEPLMAEHNRVQLKCKNVKIELITDNSEMKIEDYYYSPAYGEILVSKKIILTSNENKINWKILFE
ncbi:MAG: alginate lyase family protein [bacterium]